MSEVNLFEVASKKAYRFHASNGIVSVEDLWNIKLEDLKNIGRELNKQLKSKEDDIFSDEGRSRTDLDIQRKFDLVKYVVEYRQETARKRQEAQTKRIERQRLLDLLDRKNNEELEAMDKDEILNKLNALDSDIEEVE